MLYLLQVNVLVGIAILLPLFALYLVLMVLRLGYLAARLSLTTHANLRLQRGGVCGPPTRGLYCASDAALRWRCDPIGRRTNPVAAMIRSTEEKSEMLQCKRKVRRIRHRWINMHCKLHNRVECLCILDIQQHVGLLRRFQ